MLLKIKFSRICQHSKLCGGLNISSVRMKLFTLHMCDIVIVFTVYLTLYLSLVQLYFTPTDCFVSHTHDTLGLWLCTIC